MASRSACSIEQTRLCTEPAGMPQCWLLLLVLAGAARTTYADLIGPGTQAHA